MKEEENINNKEKESITLEEKMNIINNFHKDIKEINLKEDTITKISSYIYDSIEKYGEYIGFELFQIIESETYISPRLEYLYVINDVITKYQEENKVIINKLFPYIKEICCCSFKALNNNFREKIIELLKLWKEKEIFSESKMKILEFETKIGLEPELNGEDKEEIFYFCNLCNKGSIKFDQNFIGFSKELDMLERTKNNKHRKNLLKMEKDIILKQLKIYNSQVQKLKEIDMLLDKIKTFNELEKADVKSEEENPNITQ